MSTKDATRPRLSTFLVPLAWADLVANILIVVTGGAVRLTGSGLGCPTWPHCTDGSYVPHRELGINGAIEFTNRTLTFVLLVIALSCAAAAWRQGGRVRVLSLVVLGGIPAQAVLGGITVLTHLNPWIVAGHLLVSMAMVGVCVWLVDDLVGPVRDAVSEPSRRLAWLVFGIGWVVLWLGTVVTGSGPHSGDLDSRRTGLDPAAVAQVHGVAVWLLVAATVTLLVVARRREERVLALFVSLLLGIELAQGLIGYVQYFTDLPVVLVAAHMLGAAVISAGLARVVLTTRARA